jgi:hypothetical protein
MGDRVEHLGTHSASVRRQGVVEVGEYVDPAGETEGASPWFSPHGDPEIRPRHRYTASFRTEGIHTAALRLRTGRRRRPFTSLVSPARPTTGESTGLRRSHSHEKTDRIRPHRRLCPENPGLAARVVPVRRVPRVQWLPGPADLRLKSVRPWIPRLGGGLRVGGFRGPPFHVLYRSRRRQCERLVVSQRARRQELGRSPSRVECETRRIPARASLPARASRTCARGPDRSACCPTTPRRGETSRGPKGTRAPTTVLNLLETRG